VLYAKCPFSVLDEQSLEDGVKSIASEHTGFLLAWAIVFKEQWKEKFSPLFKAILVELMEALPDMQPRWCKGMAAVLATHAIVLTWLNPCVKVPVKGSLVPAIGIRCTTLEGFAQISMKEVRNRLKAETESCSILIKFANQDECTVEDIQKRKETKTKSAKGCKVPTSLLADNVLKRIAECCGVENWDGASGATLPVPSSGQEDT